MRVRSCIIALAALLAPGAAGATPTCDALRQIIAAADNHFANIADERTMFGTFRGEVVAPGFSDCVVAVDTWDAVTGVRGFYVRYRCLVDFDGRSRAVAFQRSVAAEAEQCLGIVPERSNEASVWFTLASAPDERKVHVEMFGDAERGFNVALDVVRFETQGQ